MALRYPTEDKLVAIAAIAQLVTETTENQYVAGLLRRHLVPQLAWTTSDFDSGKRADAWRAPSWSWASVENGMVRIIRVDDIRPRYTQLAHVQELSLELMDLANAYGALKSGYLGLQGRLIETSLVTNQPPQPKPY